MQQEFAETVAIRALAWIAADADLLGRFMGATGCDPAEIGTRTRTGDPDFMVSVLDFLMMEDDWVRGFCRDAGFDYDAPMTARRTLPGGTEMNWT